MRGKLLKLIHESTTTHRNLNQSEKAGFRGQLQWGKERNPPPINWLYTGKSKQWPANKSKFHLHTQLASKPSRTGMIPGHFISLWNFRGLLLFGWNGSHSTFPDHGPSPEGFRILDPNAFKRSQSALQHKIFTQCTPGNRFFKNLRPLLQPPIGFYGRDDLFSGRWGLTIYTWGRNENRAVLWGSQRLWRHGFTGGKVPWAQPSNRVWNVLCF